jgi:hypothetical protein
MTGWYAVYFFRHALKNSSYCDATSR